jgi:hypothetical protein
MDAEFENCITITEAMINNDPILYKNQLFITHVKGFLDLGEISRHQSDIYLKNGDCPHYHTKATITMDGFSLGKGR